MPDNRDDLLDVIYRHGDRLRARRRWLLASGLCTVVLCLIASAAIWAKREDRTHVAVGNSASTAAITTTTTTTTTTTSTSSESPSSEPATTPPTTSSQEPTTTDVPVCRNSYDRRCGPFYWDPPPPPNQPLTLDASVSSTSVHAGEAITVTVHAADPDADVFACPPPGDAMVVSGNMGGGCAQGYGACGTTGDMPRPSGPWDLFPPAPSDKTWTYTVTYTSQGTKQLDLFVWSQLTYPVDHGCPIDNPYSSSASQTFIITVS